jgi:hypothetical protein
VVIRAFGRGAKAPGLNERRRLGESGMRGDLAEHVRKMLVRYLTKRMSLRAFCQWFVPATWDIDNWASPRLRELVYGIKLRIGEYTSGYWSEEELRDKLGLFATTYEPSFALKQTYCSVRAVESADPTAVSPLPRIPQSASVEPLGSAFHTRSVMVSVSVVGR